MVFVTEYYGCVFLHLHGVWGNALALLVNDIRRCLDGSILVLRENGSGLSVSYHVCTNGTSEFVDFSPTLGALFDVLNANGCAMWGRIVAIMHTQSPVPVILKFEVCPREAVPKPVDVLTKLETIEQKHAALLEAVREFL